MAATQDARNSIGGGATNQENLIGVRLFWGGPTVATQEEGVTYVLALGPLTDCSALWLRAKLDPWG